MPDTIRNLLFNVLDAMFGGDITMGQGVIILQCIYDVTILNLPTC